jgi:hypothetical protein
MKRSERLTYVILGATLFAMGAFVGVQIWNAPRRARLSVGQPADTSVAETSDPAGGGLSSVRKSTLPPPAVRDYAENARLITDARGVTYMDAILAARGGNVARWVERKADPITVWIQPTTTVRDFWPDFRDRTRDAFYTWAASGVPLRFLFVDDSSQAEVHVVWVDRFTDSAAGKTYWARDANWWIVGADVEIALHRPTGQAYDQQMIRTIAMHEVGHLIGLDHSPNPDDIMSPKVHVMGLSAADLRTAALIYKLPPGAVAKPVAP